MYTKIKLILLATLGLILTAGTIISVNKLYTVFSSSAVRVETVTFGGSGSKTSPTTCSSSPCTIYDQTGSWVTSVTRSSTGQYVINYNTSTFSGLPTCTSTGSGVSAAAVPLIVGYASGTISVYAAKITPTGGDPWDSWASVICVGPK